jgi:hypothetical protein
MEIGGNLNEKMGRLLFGHYINGMCVHTHGLTSDSCYGLLVRELWNYIDTSIVVSIVLKFN